MRVTPIFKQRALRQFIDLSFTFLIVLLLSATSLTAQALSSILPDILLRQVDINGLSEFSKIITIQTTQTDKYWSVFPNPILDMITIRANQLSHDTEGLIQFIDANGRIVFEKTALFQEGAEVKLSIGHLTPGIYSFLISNDQGQILIAKTILRE